MGPQAFRPFLALSIIAMATVQVTAKVYHVSRTANGAKRSSFTRLFDKTLETIQECVDNLQNPGDECDIQPESYHANVVITGKHGTKDDAIIIRGDPSGKTKLDGTIPLKPSEWIKFGKGPYKAVIAQDI